MGLLIEEEKIVALLKPQVLAITTTGASADVALLEDDSIAVLQLGSVVDVTSVTVTIEGSRTNIGGSYEVLGSFTATADDGIAAIGINLAGVNFARAVVTLVGAIISTEVPISVSLIGKLTFEALGINSPTVS